MNLVFATIFLEIEVKNCKNCIKFLVKNSFGGLLKGNVMGEGDLKSKLENQLEAYTELLKDEEGFFDFLKKPVQLKFEKGVQKGVAWNIMYLPRTVGSTDADLPLLDPHASKVSFEIFLEKEKIMFCTGCEDIVLLNYRQVRKKQLKNKDLIIVGAAYIRVLMS